MDKMRSTYYPGVCTKLGTVEPLISGQFGTKGCP